MLQAVDPTVPGRMGQLQMNRKETLDGPLGRSRWDRQSSPYSPTLNQPGFQSSGVPQPLFGNALANGASNIVSVLDSNELTSLMFTDVMGMVVPRTGLEYEARGADAGRETFIREICGTLSNVYLAGWIGLLASQLFSKQLFKLNPKGIYTQSYINEQTMDAMVKLYQRALDRHTQAGGTLEQVRRAFIEDTINGLARAEFGPRQAVAQWITDHAQRKNWSDTARNYLDTLAEHVNTQAVHKFPLDPDLTRQMVEVLDRYAGKVQVWNPEKKMYQYQLIDRVVEQNLKEAVSRGTVVNTNPKALKRFRIGERIRLSKEARSQFNAHIETLVKTAEKAGLTEQVHLMGKAADGSEVVLKNQSLKKLLEETYNFIEQYSERAAGIEQGLEKKAGLGWIKRKVPITAELRDSILQGLAGKTENGFFSRLWPSLEDSLVAYTRKAKNYIVVGSVVVTIVLGMFVAYLNKWYTQRKHGGKTFFPGEGAPPPNQANRLAQQQRGGPSAALGKPALRPTGQMQIQMAPPPSATHWAFKPPGQAPTIFNHFQQSSRSKPLVPTLVPNYDGQGGQGYGGPQS